MKVTKWQLIGSFFKGHPGVFMAAFITGLAYNIFTLLIPVAIGKFYELNFNLGSKKLRLLESLNILNGHDFNSFLYLFIGLITLRFLFEYANRYLIGYLGERFSKKLREKLFSHQLHVVYPVYEEKGIGKYLLRFSGDLKGVQNYLTRGLLRFSQDVVLIIILLMVIAFVSPVFATAIIAFGLIAGLLLSLLNKVLFKVSAERRNRRSGLLAFVNTRLRAILAVKVFNKYTPELKRYSARSEKIYRIGLKYQHIVSLIYSIVPAITYLLIALLMGLIFYYVQQDSPLVEPSILLILILLIISFLPVLRRILKVSVVWKLGNISFAKLIRIFSLPRENQFEPLFNEKGLTAITFNKVSFRYENTGSLVFDKLTLNLTQPGIYQLAGTTGSGKTTFLKLLLAIYKPTAGTIAYEGITEGKVTELAIRRQMAVVADMVPLYGRNVYEAVVYSRNKERKSRAKKLLATLQQHEPETLKLTLENKIGDLGANLTTGQRKIAMYVRAFLTNKPVLVLENPFAALSEQTTRLLQKKITAFAKQGMVVVLSTTTKSLVAGTKRYKIEDQQILQIQDDDLA